MNNRFVCNRTIPIMANMRLRTYVKIGLLTLAAGVSSLCVASGEVTYNFAHLKAGAISTSTRSDSGNQDGWYMDPAPEPPTSLMVTTNSSGNCVSVPVLAVLNSGRGIRNFGSSFYLGTETTAMLQFDVVMGSGYTAVHVALGGNGSSRTFLNTNGQAQFGPRVMVYAYPNKSLEFKLFAKKPKEGLWTSGTAQSIKGTPGHSYRVKLVMDFTANGGAGAGTLYYKDLTAGDGDFKELTSIGTVPLNLSTGVAKGYGPENWDQVYIRCDEGPGAEQATSLDNIVIGGT